MNQSQTRVALTRVANNCPTSAITERVNGMPTIAKRMQKRRPPNVFGAMFPYPLTDGFSLVWNCWSIFFITFLVVPPIVVRIVVEKKTAWI